MITNNTNSFKTNVIMFFFLIAKDEFVHPISELGPSSAGPLFEPAREARRQESPPNWGRGVGVNCEIK